MKRTFLILIFILACVAAAMAQKTRVAQEHGTGVPASTACIPGVEYVNDATGDIYTYKTGTGCVLSGNTAAGVGDVVGPSSSVDNEIALFNSTTGKLIKRASTTGILKATSGVIAAAVAGTDYQAPLGFTAENSANKDATGGYAGLTLFKINFNNTANTFRSFLINANTAARNYTFQDRNGTIADDTDLAGKVSTGATAISAGLFCSDAGANDTYTCSLNPALASYVVGTHIRFFANTANTGAASINFNSLGALTIVKVAGGITTTLADNDIRAGQWVDGVIAAGSNFQIQSTLGNAPSGGGGANTVTASILLSSTVVDLNEVAGAKQALYTCPSSRRCIVTNIVMQKASADPALAVVKIGWDVTAVDVAGSINLANALITASRAGVFAIADVPDGVNTLSPAPVIGTAGDVLGLIVSTREGSALTAKVDVYGYLTDTSGVPIANVNGTGDGATIAPSNITGTTTNNNASAGAFGEYVESLIASGSATSLTTATAKNVTSISLTAGDWDVSGNINFAATTATVTGTQGGISSTSATLPTDGSEVFSGVQVTLISENDSVTLPRKRISIASTTTVYLVAKSTFSAGSVSAYGSINARRVR